MVTVAETIRVAAVQASSVFLDRRRTVEKAVSLVHEAAGNGARLIAFGEGYVPGHPVWFHFLPVTDGRSIELSSRLANEALTIPGPETEALAEAARATSATIVIGVAERPIPAIPRLYDSLLVFFPDGSFGVRRKICPAVGEKVVFRPGGGESIRTFPAPWGPLSALLAGENANPLLTYALRASGARVHVAAWPPHFNRPGLMGELMGITGRAIAYQNSAFVVSVGGALTPETIVHLVAAGAPRAMLEQMAADPVSAIYGPRGALLAGPLPGGEGILYADLDLGTGAWAGLVNRHYDRPDLLRLLVDRRPDDAEVRFVDADEDLPIEEEQFKRGESAAHNPSSGGQKVDRRGS